MPAEVTVRDLTKHYGAVAALRGIGFDVHAGEIFGLLGPNGAGKTTTIECLLGLRRPDSGTIVIDGIDALAEPKRVQAFAGAVLQATALQDKITPRQALRLFASFHRPRADVEELLARFALTEKADATFDTLSGGQRQRLALALAFVNLPRLLVLDEPTAGLDPAARRDLHETIQRQRAGGCTVLLSTHQMEEAQRLCDRLAILDAGRIVATGTPDELIACAGALARITVRAARPLDDRAVRALEGVASCTRDADSWTLLTADVNGTVMALVQALAREGNELRDLRIERPSLEDAFLQLTGRRWSDASAEGARP